MRRRYRRRLPKHTIVPDTSVLFFEDKRELANPAFEEFWKEYSALVPLELAIPHAVHGELLFQHVNSCLRQHERVETGFAHLVRSMDVNHKLPFTGAEIRKAIEGKFDRWLSKHQASVIPIPPDIDMHRLCDAAIWRKSPFTFDPKNSDNEKGFRDALIVESASARAALANSSNVVVFLCADKLLRETVISRITNKYVLFHESLGELTSYLKLISEQHARQVATRMVEKATSKFYSLSDQTCIWMREDIGSRLVHDYRKLLEDEVKEGTYVWSANSALRLFVTKAEFVRQEGAVSIWRSTVTLVRSYDLKTINTGVNEFFKNLIEATKKLAGEKLFQVKVNVEWTAKLDVNGRLSGARSSKIELDEKKFDTYDDSLKQRYPGLQPISPKDDKSKTSSAAKG